MIEVRVTREFEDQFRDLPETIQRRAEKQQRLFRHNPFHPSLHKATPAYTRTWFRRCETIFQWLAKDFL